MLCGVFRLEDVPAIIAAHETALHMRVAVKLYPRARNRLQGVDRLTQRLNVNVLVGCRSVHNTPVPLQP